MPHHLTKSGQQLIHDKYFRSYQLFTLTWLWALMQLAAARREVFS